MAEEDKAPQQPPAWLLAYPPFQRQDSLATQMVISDTKLQQCRRCIRFEPMPPGSALVLGDPSCVPANAIGSQSVIPSLMDYASQRPANILIPPAEKPSDDAVEEQQKGFWETSGKVEGPGAKTSANHWSDHTTWESSSSHTDLGSAGDLFESRQSIKHEGIDGVTRSASRDDALLVQSDVIRAQRMDQLAIAPNEDFRNKFPTIDALTIAKAEAEAKAEGAVADGKFGDESDVFSGSGSVLGGEMVGKASAELSTKAATAAVEAIIGGHFAKGEVKSADDVLVYGKVGGEVASAEAKASGEVVLSPEEATLKGTLKAEALLGQIEGEGVIEITPKRVGNSAISAWNFVTRDDVATLGDEHDWGIKFALGGSLSLGVQAEAEAEGTASASRVGAKAKAKVGLGIGAGVTVGAELKGLDKVWGSMKTAGIAVGDAASRGGALDRWKGGIGLEQHQAGMEQSMEVMRHVGFILNRRKFMATMGATIMAGGAKGQSQSGLALEKGTDAPLALKIGAPLDCSMPLPDGWMVTPDATVTDSFAPAEIFEELTRRQICYDPLNRDRCEIELFAARIVPDRVGLAAQYAQILAREWGPDKHGTAAHDPLFGEVLTGGDWFGLPSLTRISVWRRGEWLLIQRARYRTDHAGEYQSLIAGMVGGMGFGEPAADPIAESLRPDVLELEEGTISTLRPEWWRDPGFAEPPRDKGQFKFWVDEADALRNSGAMIAVQRVEPLPDNMATPPAGIMTQQADSVLEFFVTNLLPGQNVTRKPTAAFTLERTDRAAFDQTQVFRLDFEKSGLVGIAQVTQVLTRDGRLVSSVMMTQAPLTLDTVAPHLHATWFENQINAAVTGFLNTRRAL